MRKVLVTGGAGFIGANFLNYFVKKYPDYEIYNVDILTYASNYNNIKHLEALPNYKFYKVDICNTKIISELISQNNIDTIIHFAAESHVDNSIDSPVVFAKTNILGTLNLLQAAFKEWFTKPFSLKEKYENSRFIHISTDEVYGTLDHTGFFTEKSKYAPNSPYSASKASSDMLVRSFYHTYGMNVMTTNCSNNYGPFQHNEKLIPKMIENAIRGKELPIYGNGSNVRDWLYVTDHCKAIDLVLHGGKIGETYLIGGNNEKSNKEVTNLICEILDKKLPGNKSYKSQIRFVNDRYGHDFRYAIDCSKIKNELAWEPGVKFEQGLEQTIDWYLTNILENA